MVVSLLYVVFGLAILLGGGYLTIRGAVSLAFQIGVSPLVIGMTIVAFGTSAPELVVSIQAVLGGHPDIVLGNVVGSNIANIVLIVGAASAVKMLVLSNNVAPKRDIWALFIFTIAFTLCCWRGQIGQYLSVLLVILLVFYSIWSFVAAKKETVLSVGSVGESNTDTTETPLSLGLALGALATGIIGVVLGAYLLVDGSVETARILGVSKTIIGLTVIAIGTSLPELVTSILAALRGQPGLAIGNVMGSNLFNMLGITGISAAVAPEPLQVPGQVLILDLWVMSAATVLLCVSLLKDWRITRIGGFVMVALYSAYICFQFGARSF